MKDAAAFKACYCDWRLIKGRKVVQVVLELPIEQADQAYQALGGMPNPAESAWVAVARLKPERQVVPDRPVQVSGHNEQPASEPEPPVRARKPVAPEKRLAAEAGRMCADKEFQRFLYDNAMINGFWANEEKAALAVRMICGVESRADIRPGTTASEKWDQLMGQFEMWKAA